jgi:hypothetical protein
MPARKMKVEVYDNTGNKYTISIEGKVSRSEAQRILDIVELIGGLSRNTLESYNEENISKIEKVRFVLDKKFPLIWFTSKDFQKVYENELKEKIRLSAASTYLTRLSKRGILTRMKRSNRVYYRLFSKGLEKLIKNNLSH